MAKIIIETQYIPTIAFYSFALNNEMLLIDTAEHYQKGSFRNRTSILSSQGKLTLSIPLKSGKNSQTPINEVLIDQNSNWQKSHLQTIKSCYGKAPYFEFYYPFIEEVLSMKHHLLYDLNALIIKKINKWLNLEKKIVEIQNFLENSNDEFTIKRNVVSPKTKYFKNLKEQFNFIPYEQVFSEVVDFEPNLSILDLLMCKGPEARIYLRDIWKQKLT